MALSPKERADFDEIVLRLRLEDADLSGRPRRRPLRVVLGAFLVALTVSLGIVLVSNIGLLATVLIAVMVGVLAAGGRLVYRMQHSGRRP